MPPRSEISPYLSSSLQIACAALLVVGTGCSGPYIRSQQTAYQSAPKGEYAAHVSESGTGVDCGLGCDDGQLRLGLPRFVLHAISGPFIPREIVDPYQSTVHPPHSKFHPVPTRPVFAPLRQIGPLAPTSPEGPLAPTRPEGPPAPTEMLPPPTYRTTHRVVRPTRPAQRPSQGSVRAGTDEARFVEL
jgi:hypothetical protein